MTDSNRKRVTADTIPSKHDEATERPREFPGETELPDDYPIYGNYIYIADGKPYRSDWHAITARELKRREGFKVVCRCNLAARCAALSAEREK